MNNSSVREIDVSFRISYMGESKRHDPTQRPLEGIFDERDFFIQYTVSGTGSFVLDGTRHAIKRGDAFLLRPHDRFRFEANEDNPWHFIWLQFNGAFAEVFLRDCFGEGRVYHTSNPYLVKSAFEDTLAAFLRFDSDPSEVGASLFQLMCAMKRTNEERSIPLRKNQSDTIFHQAKNFIDTNITLGVRVSDVIRFLHVDRSYLFKLFHKRYGISPQRYILNQKLAYAYKLICVGGVSVKRAAESVGYVHQSEFSKLFKAHYGFPPSALK